MGCSSDPVSVTPQKKDIFAPQNAGDTTSLDASQDGASSVVDHAEPQSAATAPGNDLSQSDPVEHASQAVSSEHVSPKEQGTSAEATATAGHASEKKETSSVSDADMERIAAEAKKCVDGGGVYNTFAQKCFQN